MEGPCYLSNIFVQLPRSLFWMMHHMRMQTQNKAGYVNDVGPLITKEELHVAVAASFPSLIFHNFIET